MAITHRFQSLHLPLFTPRPPRTRVFSHRAESIDLLNRSIDSLCGRLGVPYVPVPDPPHLRTVRLSIRTEPADTWDPHGRRQYLDFRSRVTATAYRHEHRVPGASCSVQTRNCSPRTAARTEVNHFYHECRMDKIIIRLGSCRKYDEPRRAGRTQSIIISAK